MDAFYFEDYLPLFMFAALGMLLFCGYPVAFVLGGIGLAFGFIGMYFEVFDFIQFFNVAPRIWGGIAENLVLTAIPMFIFMGTMLERSGVASDLLHCLQVLLRRVPGGLALAVTLMGTIMAATTGIIGASVVMITLLALPVMVQRSYNIPLATGTIAASGTLGILIPPSIMLVIMADLLSRSVGNLFVAAVFPGLLLAGFYILFITVLCGFRPRLAPPLPEDMGPGSSAELAALVLKSFIPPIFLVFLVLGSILFGWATPTEAAGVGAAGAILLAIFNRKLNFTTLRDVVERSALTGAMLFGIFLGATGTGLYPRLLFRLDRDHVDRAAGLFADHRAARLRRPCRQGRGGLLVRDPAGGQPADLVPDAAFRLRLVLYEGRGAARGTPAADLQGHRALRHPSALRSGDDHDLPGHRAVAAAGAPELTARSAQAASSCSLLIRYSISSSPSRSLGSSNWVRIRSSMRSI
jgi:tripartite ATP-independent transporter DctM subunit